MLPRTLKSVLFPSIWMLTFTVAAVGCEDGSTPQDRALRPRLSSPGALEIRAPSVPNQVVRVRHDSADSFGLISTATVVEAFIDALPALRGLRGCRADFNDLGVLPALCVDLVPTESLVVDVTAVSDNAGDETTWSDLDRFDEGCVVTERADTLRCTIDREGQRLSPLATFTDPQTPQPTPRDCVATVTGSGGISTIAAWNDQLIVGGSFFQGFVKTYDGPFKLDDGTTVTDCLPGADGVRSSFSNIIEDPEGGLIISGGFASYGGDDRCRSVARLTADGEVDGDFCAALPTLSGAGPVLALADPILYMATSSEIIAFDLAQRTVVATSPALTIQDELFIASIVVADGVVYFAARNLSQIGDQAVTQLGALDAQDLTPLPFAPVLDEPVTALVTTPGRLWVGGQFTTPRMGVAVFNTSDRTLLPIDLQLDAGVFKLARSPEGVWVGGSFETISGQVRNAIALVNESGTVLSDELPLSLTSGQRYSVFDVAEVDGVVSVVGSFDTVGGTPQPAFARFRRSDLGVLPATRVTTGPQLFPVGGDDLWIVAPNGVDVAERSSAGIIDPVTETVDPLDFEVEGGQLSDVYVDGDVAYLTGFFASVLGQPRPGIAAVDLTTGALLPFRSDIVDFVTGVAFGPDTVYVAGGFTVDGVTRRMVALNKSDGSLKDGFNLELVADNVRSIIAFGNDIILGGLIQSVNGVDRGDLVWIDAETGANSSVTTTLDTAASPVVLLDGELYVQSFTTAQTSGLPEDDRLFAINPATGALRNWQPGITRSGIDTITKIGNAIMLAGFEIQINDEVRSIWALDATTADVLPWILPSFTGQPNVFLRRGDQVVIGTSAGELLIVDPPQ